MTKSVNQLGNALFITFVTIFSPVRTHSIALAVPPAASSNLESVYLLAFIASATVVSAEMTWTLSDQAACAALGARGCDYDEYTKKTSTTYDRKVWYQTETDCNAQSNSCVF